jgi:hypothetical protein
MIPVNSLSHALNYLFNVLRKAAQYHVERGSFKSLVGYASVTFLIINAIF